MPHVNCSIRTYNARMSARTPIKTLLWYAVFVTAVPIAQQATGQTRFDGTDDYVRKAMSHWEVPGLAIAVVKDGEVVLQRAYGVCEIGRERAVTVDTLFDIASCTKSFTAASIGLLVDEGKLDWDDPVVKHLPDLELSDSTLTRQVTLRDLLCHRTGLLRADLLGERGDMSRAELVRRARYLEPVAPFRTKNTYNNLMYVAIGDVIAAVSGVSYEQFIFDRLLTPLQMTTATFTPTRDQNVAPKHWRDEAKVVPRAIPSGDIPHAPAGGLHCSISEMTRWLQFQLSRGESADNRILQEKTVREMHAMHQAVPITRRPTDSPYAARFLGAGLGWYTWDYRGRRLVVHSGSWGAIVGLVPEEELGVVVLSNLDWNGLSGMLMYRALDSYCAPHETIWDEANFKQFDMEGPGHACRRRDTERNDLAAERKGDSKRSLPLEAYAQDYDSDLFGDLAIAHDRDALTLTIGRFATTLTHWEANAFYARTPTRLNYDWLVKFETEKDQVRRVRLQYVGWQEPDAVFISRPRQRGPGWNTNGHARKLPSGAVLSPRRSTATPM